jgi:hypothetical protein
VVTTHTSDRARVMDSKTVTGKWADLHAPRVDTETERTLSMWVLLAEQCDPSRTRS